LCEFGAFVILPDFRDNDMNVLRATLDPKLTWATVNEHGLFHKVNAMRSGTSTQEVLRSLKNERPAEMG
jgi:hypothetical protein